MLGCWNLIPYNAKCMEKNICITCFSGFQRVICSVLPWLQIMVSVSKPYHQWPDPDSIVLNFCYTETSCSLMLFKIGYPIDLQPQKNAINSAPPYCQSPAIPGHGKSMENKIFQICISLFQILMLKTEFSLFCKVKCQWCRFQWDPKAVHQDWSTWSR